ncbi:MAG: CdvA-like protein [Nitrososphaerales archaeon]
MSTADTLYQKYVGKAVKDIYGTYVGSVLGITTDTSGQLVSAAIDAGSDGFVELPKENLKLEEEYLVRIPRWKIETDTFATDTSVVQKRLHALEELEREGEIAPEEYDNIAKVYKEKGGNLKDTYSGITNTLNEKAQHLETHSKSLRRFLTTLKVQYKSGEVSSECYTSSVNNLNGMNDRLQTEKKDILNLLSTMQPDTIDEPLPMKGNDMVNEFDPAADTDEEGEAKWLSRILKLKD